MEAKGARDYYSFDLDSTGNLDVTLGGLDAPEGVQFRVYWVDPTSDVPERPISPTVFVPPGQSRTTTVAISAVSNNQNIRDLGERLTEEGGATIIVEVIGAEQSNIGGYSYGTVSNYELDFDVPGTGTGGGSSGSGSGGGGGATGGGGRGSQPGNPSVTIEPVTPDPRSTGVPRVEVTFSEDVMNVDIDDFELTRDGEEIDLSGVVVEEVTPSDYVVNLAGLTQQDGEYTFRIRTSDITDTDDNGLTSGDSDTWTVDTVLTNFNDFVDSEVGDGAAENDDGESSLRSAIQEANAVEGTDVITLAAGTYDLSIDGHFEDLALIGDLNITDDLTIVGAGAGVTIIEANEVDRIFHIFPGVNVTIEGVTLSGGEAHDGGAILNEGTLEIFDSNIINSRAFNQGGGIYLSLIHISEPTRPY